MQSRFRCNECKRIFKTSPSGEGRWFTCPDCDSRFVIKLINDSKYIGKVNIVEEDVQVIGEHVYRDEPKPMAAKGDPDTIRFLCKKCNGLLLAPESNIGQVVLCERCLSSTKVPARSLNPIELGRSFFASQRPIARKWTDLEKTSNAIGIVFAILVVVLCIKLNQHWFLAILYGVFGGYGFGIFIMYLISGILKTKAYEEQSEISRQDRHRDRF